jgi:hypothetical protein
MQVFGILARDFRFLFACQLPVGFVEILQQLLGVHDSVQASWVATLIVLPVFFMASFFSSAMTFISVRLRLAEHMPSRTLLGEGIAGFAKPLVLASLVVGTLIGLGLAAIILPGLVFMALCLFVPHLIISDPPASIPVYLYRSRKLAMMRPWMTICIVSVFFIMSTGLFLLGESTGTAFGIITGSFYLRQAVLVGVRMFFTMAGGMLMDVFVSVYFLRLRAYAPKVP